MATYTTNFPSWSDIEALAKASDDFETTSTYTTLKDTTTHLSELMVSSDGWTYSRSSNVITGNHTSGAVLHYYGYNLGTASPHLTGQDITDGVVRLFMSESLEFDSFTGGFTGTVFSADVSGLGYWEHSEGNIPLNSSVQTWSSWASTTPTALGDAVSSATGTRTCEADGRITTTFSTATASDAAGHSITLSNLTYSVTYTLPDHPSSVDALHAMLAGDDVAYGAAATEELRTFGGNDTLDGLAGADTLVGGSGNDVYLVENAGDIVTELAAEGSDEIRSSVTFTLPANVEKLSLTGSAVIDGTGNVLDNVLDGNSASNTLDGGDGNDTLTGGAAADVFSFAASGNGIDTITDFTSIDSIHIVGASFSTVPATGDGGSVGRNQVRVLASGDVTTLYIGTDDVPGADVAIRLGGVFSASQFNAFGNTIGFNHVPTGAVTIAGTPAQGHVLTASHNLADADGLGTVTYQWQAGSDGTGWSNLGTGSSIALGEAQVGRQIRVVAGYSDARGSAETPTSIATAVVANVNDAPTGTLGITGTAAQGHMLMVADTLADADGLGRVAYQWQSSTDGQAWSNLATGRSLFLGAADIGSQLRVVAAYTDGHGSVESVTSTATASVTATADTTATTIRAYSWRSHTLLEGVSLDSRHSTGTDGCYSYAASGTSLDLAPTREVPAGTEHAAATGAVNLLDAIAVLKMIVGLNVNGGGKPLSPYQALAADYDENGSVDLVDAISVLKHVVGLGATEPKWVFVAETDVTVPAKATTTPGAVAEVVHATVAGQTGLVGVLRGDVDGSWAAPAGSSVLADTYFDNVHTQTGIDLSQWGIYPA